MNGPDGTRSAFSFRTLPQGGSSGPAHDERTNGSGSGATGEDRRGSSQPERCDVQSNDPPGNQSDLGIKPHLLCLLHWQAGSLQLVSPGKLT